MPLLRVDVIEGRSEAELKEFLDAIHCAMLAAFKVPERDRYQIVHEHPATEIIIEDTGLGIPRTEQVVMVQVTTRPRSRLETQNFYELLCQELLRRCGVKASDVVVQLRRMLMKSGPSATAEPSSLTEKFDSGDGLPPTITRDYTELLERARLGETILIVDAYSRMAAGQVKAKQMLSFD